MVTAMATTLHACHVPDLEALPVTTSSGQPVTRSRSRRGSGLPNPEEKEMEVEQQKAS